MGRRQPHLNVKFCLWHATRRCTNSFKAAATAAAATTISRFCHSTTSSCTSSLPPPALWWFMPAAGSSMKHKDIVSFAGHFYYQHLFMSSCALFWLESERRIGWTRHRQGRRGDRERQGRRTDWETGRETDRRLWSQRIQTGQTERHCRQRDKQTDRVNRQTGQTNRTDRQAEWRTDRETDRQFRPS